MDKKVNISYACPIPWESMVSINDKESYCSRCSRNVRDFSQDKSSDTKGIECGRFRIDQVKSINRTFNFNPRQVFVISLLSLMGISAPMHAQAQVESNQTNPIAKVYQKKSFKITGMVSDSLTGEALPFVNVVLKDTSGFIVAGSSTGFEGQFSIEPISTKLRNQDFSLEFSFTGYQDKIPRNSSLDPSAVDVVIEIELKPSEIELTPVIIEYVTGLIDPSRTDSTELRKDSFEK